MSTATMNPEPASMADRIATYGEIKKRLLKGKRFMFLAWVAQDEDINAIVAEVQDRDSTPEDFDELVESGAVRMIWKRVLKRPVAGSVPIDSVPDATVCRYVELRTSIFFQVVDHEAN